MTIIIIIFLKKKGTLTVCACVCVFFFLDVTLQLFANRFLEMAVQVFNSAPPKSS